MKLFNLRKDIGGFLLGLALFIVAQPFYFWHTSIPVLVYFILLLYFYIKSFNKTHSISTFIFAFCLYLFYTLNAGQNIYGSLLLLSVSFLFLISESVLVNAYDKFIKVLAILLIPSIIQYVLVKFIGLNFPSTTIQPLLIAKDFTYNAYWFFTDDNMNPFAMLPRFFGYFDEPGLLGSFCGMILISREYKLKDTTNLILFASGLLTFSMYFYILSIMYFLFFTNYRYRWLSLLLLVLVVVSIYLSLKDTIIGEFFFNRFIIEDGHLVGNTRTDNDFDYYFSQFLNTNDIWFGRGGGYALKLTDNISSYKAVIIESGIIFFVLYMLLFVILAHKNLKFSKCFWAWLLLFSTCIYQRPVLSKPEYVFIWISSIYYLKSVNYNECQCDEKRQR